MSSKRLLRPGSVTIWQGGGAGPDGHKNRGSKVCVGLIRSSKPHAFILVDLR